MPSPVLIAKPATPQWQPSHRLGVGLTFACIFDSPGITQRNIVGRGVSDVTLINAVMTRGAYGPTAQFGTGTYARAARSTATQPTGGYTVAALVRSNGTPAAALPIMACASWGAVDATWYLGVSSGLPRFARRTAGGSYDAASAGSYTWGTDYHLFAGTIVPTSNTASAGAIYLHADGDRIATGSFATGASSYTADPLLIGSLYDSTSNSVTAWPGDVAAVYIWNRPLSNAEHAALAADPFAPVRPRPRAWFALAATTAATLDATAQAASTSLSATVSIPGTLGASSQAATTSLASTVTLTATLGATAEAAATAIAGQVAVPATLGATAADASTSAAASVTISATLSGAASNSQASMAASVRLEITLSAASGPATTSLAMSRLALHFLQAIRERLNGEDGLGYEIDVTNVYLQKSLESETSSYPFVIVNPVNEYPDPLTNCTDGGPFSSEVQFTVFSTDDEEAMRIRDAAYRVLAPGKPLLVFGDGVDRAHIPGLKWQFTQPGQKPGGKLIWAFGFQYRFLLERSY